MTLFLTLTERNDQALIFVNGEWLQELRPPWNGNHFADGIFIYIFFEFEFSLTIENRPSLCQVSWRLTDVKPLYESIEALFIDAWLTRFHLLIMYRIKILISPREKQWGR